MIREEKIVDYSNFHVPIQLKEHVKDKKTFNELIVKAQSGCKESLDFLVESNLKLVLNLVNKFKGKERLYEDLFQLGTIGLIKAIERFDLSREVHFSTYAVPLILGEIKRELRDNQTLKVSRNIQDNAKKIKDAYEIILIEKQREPRFSEIVERTNLKKEEVSLALSSTNEIVSLSGFSSNAEGDKAIATEDKVKNEKCYIDEWLQKDTIKKAFELLNEKEKTIIHLRYFEEKTQQEIGEYYGMSQAHVSRMEKQALIKLRQVI